MLERGSSLHVHPLVKLRPDISCYKERFQLQMGREARDTKFMTLDAKRARYLDSNRGKNKDKGIEPFIFHSFIYVRPFDGVTIL